MPCNAPQATVPVQVSVAERVAAAGAAVGAWQDEPRGVRPWCLSGGAGQAVEVVGGGLRSAVWPAAGLPTAGSLQLRLMCRSQAWS